MIDFSKAINMKRVFSKDAFHPGKAYRIRIHDIDKMTKMINVSDYDDDDMTSYSNLIEGLFKQFNTNGFDAICGKIRDDYVVFVSSYFGRLSNKIMTFDITIDIDTFYEFIDSDKTLMRSDIEIFETRPVIPVDPIGFKPAEKPNTTTEGLMTDKSPKKKKRSWIERLAASQHGDDSTATGDNR